ncbi:hypothetical protein ACOSQ3_020875 [Xanthoceras sorbifolium]
MARTTAQVSHSLHYKITKERTSPTSKLHRYPATFWSAQICFWILQQRPAAQDNSSLSWWKHARIISNQLIGVHGWNPCHQWTAVANFLKHRAAPKSVESGLLVFETSRTYLRNRYVMHHKLASSYKLAKGIIEL